MRTVCEIPTYFSIVPFARNYPEDFLFPSNYRLKATADLSAMGRARRSLFPYLCGSVGHRAVPQRESQLLLPFSGKGTYQ